MRTTLHFFFLEGISAGELMFVFFIILLFFGSKSIPKMARTFGRGMRQIREASQQIQDDIKQAATEDIPNQIVKKDEPKK
jgi:sec-independent protein translocase protein TatA